MITSNQFNEYRFFTENVEKSIDLCETNFQTGLTEEEAQHRLEYFGRNELTTKKKIPKWKIFLNQFKDTLIYILIIAAIISAIVERGGQDWIVISIIIILNAIIGYIQEEKADAAIEALKEISAPQALVIRNDIQSRIFSYLLVPGDIILLREGDRIPADARIIEAVNLKCEEAALTGESVPVNKHNKIIDDPECNIAEQKNMVFSSTLVTYGRAKAVVVATGMKSEVGKIAGLLAKEETKLTPLQIKLEQFGNWLGKIILLICAIVWIVSVIRTQLWLEELINAVALAVAAIPEGLPAVVTTCLAIGVTRMSKNNAIVKKLHSVETLGCTTVICSDKTGTLTRNEMTVRKIWVASDIYEVSGVGYEPKGYIRSVNQMEEQKIQKNNPDLDLCLRIGTLCNDAHIEKKKDGSNWICFGDPTEGCLVTSAWKKNLLQSELEFEFPRLDELPFDSNRKRMTTIHKIDGMRDAYIKGAPEILLHLSTHIQKNGQIKQLTENDQEEIMHYYEEQASHALRGLGFAFRPNVDAVPLSIETMEKELVFVGMQFMIDPPREEVKKAIEECRSAQIKVKMITGDNLMTAKAIALELGMIENMEEPAYEGRMIESLSDEQIAETRVFARVSPEHKLNIVNALQRQNEIVAMTGDGVNDAPALKTANVGVAMGITGTDVSKEAAVMVLADDNFATIVKAVEEGRGIYDNIKKFIIYLLGSNLAEVLILFVAALVGLPIPIVATQLLWINLVTDGAPALALGVDPYDPSLMKQPPRNPDENILTSNFKTIIVVVGIIITAYILLMEYFYLDPNIMGERIAPFTFEEAKEELPWLYEWVQNNYTRFEVTSPLEAWDVAYREWKARSVVFAIMMFAEMANTFNCRSEYNSIKTIGLFSNRSMIFAVSLSCILTLVLYIPGFFLGEIFYVVPLSAFDWIWSGIAIILVIGSIEFLKIFLRRRGNIKINS